MRVRWSIVRLGVSIIAGLVFLGMGVAWEGRNAGGLVRAAEEKKERPAAAAVEESMHEFMEYVFEPTYKRLKANMAAAPADNAVWKALKGDSLSLAEAGNLLLLRHPDKDDQAWAQHSVQVRTLGGQLYAAARKKDYPAARQHYEAMIAKCNACHEQFAGGEHILKP